MTRITKDWLKVKKQIIVRRTSELLVEIFRGSALTDWPDLCEQFQKTFPYRAPGQRPAFAAAAVQELIHKLLDEEIPDSLLD